MPVNCSIGLEDYIIQNDVKLTFHISLSGLLKLAEMLLREKNPAVDTTSTVATKGNSLYDHHEGAESSQIYPIFSDVLNKV